MIRKKSLRTLYREIIREALTLAWRERRLWPLALLAGLLQTGGLYDIIFRFTASMPEQARMLLERPATVSIFLLRLFAPAATVLDRHLVAARLIEGLLLGGLLVAAVVACSIVAQGALVFALGTRLGRFRNIKSCLAVGARHFWPVLTLNVMSLGLLWVARFALVAPLTHLWNAPSVPLVIGYVVAVLVFLDIAIALVTTHLFGLQAIVLDELSTLDAIRHAYRLFRSSWLIIIEGAGALLLSGVIFFFIALAIFLTASIPLIILLAAAATLQLWSLVWIALWIGIVLFSLIMLLCCAFTVTFQYAAWSHLYARTNHGLAASKIWRLVHSALTRLQHLRPA